MLSFDIPETHFSLYFAYALRYRKNNEKFTPFNKPRRTFSLPFQRGSQAYVPMMFYV